MELTTEQIIEEMLQEATAATIAEQRLKQRHPFFRHVTITLDGADATELSGFSRDIAPGGLGLLHDAPLQTELVSVKIPTMAGRWVDIRLRIRWCYGVGQGWYVSGGQFVGLSTQQTTSLLLVAVGKEIERRLKRRHPFFRPVMITVSGGAGTKISGFVKDISPGGIGLLHEAPLERRPVIVSIPTTAGRRVDIRINITWCTAVGQGWHVSGGQFTRLELEELQDLLL